MDKITLHARLRCAQRNVNRDTIAFVEWHGRKIHRTGATFYFLGRRNIPEHLRDDDRYAKLEGTVLLAGPDGGFITVYRNRQALKAIRKKLKYHLPAKRRSGLTEGSKNLYSPDVFLFGMDSHGV